MPRRNFYLLLLVIIAAVACSVQSDRHGRLLTYAMRQIGQRHLEEIDRQDLFEGAMEGMTRQLEKKYADRHSGYVPPAAVKRFNEQLDQEFGGLGIMVTIPEETGRLTVASPLVGTPAYAAGILPGDVILKIDGRDTEGMTLQEAADRMHGEVGQPVRLTILHEGDQEPVEMTIRRAVIQVPSVLGDTPRADGSWDFFLEGEDRIGYVRIDNVGEKTDKELRKTLDWLIDHDMQGLILDLRNNSGGYLLQAVTICDMFVDSGVIVSTRGRDGKIDQKYPATSNGTYRGFPMAVLINQYTASAAEIIAACLQDHDCAVIVGQRSYGKGVVQELLYLDAEEGARRGLMKVTSSSYWRPSGENINRGKDADEDDQWGVRPDEGLEVIVEDEDLKRLFLARHRRDIYKAPDSNGKKQDKEKESPHGDDRPPASDAKDTADTKPSTASSETEAGGPRFDPQLELAIEYIRKQIAQERREQ